MPRGQLVRPLDDQRPAPLLRLDRRSGKTVVEAPHPRRRQIAMDLLPHLAHGDAVKGNLLLRPVGMGRMPDGLSTRGTGSGSTKGAASMDRARRQPDRRGGAAPCRCTGKRHRAGLQKGAARESKEIVSIVIRKRKRIPGRLCPGIPSSCKSANSTHCRLSHLCELPGPLKRWLARVRVKQNTCCWRGARSRTCC